MKRSMKRTIATTLSVLALSQTMYAKDLSVMVRSNDRSGEQVMAEKDEASSSIILLDQVMKKVEKELEITDDYKLGYSYLNTEDMYLKRTWNLSYDKQNDPGDIDIQVDAESGEILSFEICEDYYNNVLKYTRDEVRKTATDYLNKHYKKYKSELVELDESADIDGVYLSNDRYHFIYGRKLGGESFTVNYIAISVSGITGKVVALRKRWDDISYESSGTMSINEALTYFKERGAIKVKYEEMYNEGKKVLRPVYYFDYGLRGMLDVKSKSFLKAEDIYMHNGEYRTKDTAAKEDYGMNEKSVQEEEIIPEKGAISREDAEAILIKSLQPFTDVTNMKITSSNYNGYHYGVKGKFWHLRLESQEPEYYVRATVDAVTKDILSFSYRVDRPENILFEYQRLYSSGEMSKEEFDKRSGKLLAAGMITKKQYDNRYDTTSEVDTEAIKKQANDLITKMFPALKDEQISPMVKQQDTGIVRVEGDRTFDNIPYHHNGYNMDYDIESGAFTYISYNWSNNLQVERPKSIISQAEATKLFYDEVGIEKKLILLIDKEREEQEEVIVPKKELALVYDLKDYGFRYIDAVTGEFIRYNGDIYTDDDEVRVFTDIEGHAYERAINLTNKMGYLEEMNHTFSPNEILKKKDAIKWMVNALDRNSIYFSTVKRERREEEFTFKDIKEDDPYYRYIKEALNMDMIQQANYFNPNRQMTMEEVVRYIVNGMGHRALANSGIFLDIEDVAAKYDGYIGLGKFYKMVNDNTNLKEELTRGKMVQILYDFVNHLENE